MGIFRHMKDMRDMVNAAPDLIDQAQQAGAQAQQLAEAQRAALQAQMGRYTGMPPGAVPLGQPAASFGQPAATFGQPGASFGQPAATFGQPGTPFGQRGASFGQTAATFGQPGGESPGFDFEPIDGVTLDQFAAVSKAVAGYNYDAARLPEIAASMGIPATSWENAAQGWNGRLRANPAVAMRFSQLYRQL